MAQKRKRDNPDDMRMSFGDHLEELRRCLIMALVGVGIAMVLTLIVSKYFIIPWLYVPLAQAQHFAGLSAQSITTTPSGGFMIYLKVSFVSAAILSAPWILYQFWRFVVVGLYSSERSIVKKLVPFSTVMTAAGVLFMYYIMLPVCLWFFISFTVSFPEVRPEPSGMFSWLFKAQNETPAEGAGEPTTQSEVPPQNDPDEKKILKIPLLEEDPEKPAEQQIWLNPQGALRIFFHGKVHTVPLATTSLLTPLIDIHHYFSFITALTLGIVIAFQLPVIMLILGWTGVVDPSLLARYRRHCVFVCFAIGMFLTPSDLPSMILLALPLWGLFEMGLIIMRRAYWRDRVKQ